MVWSVTTCGQPEPPVAPMYSSAIVQLGLCGANAKAGLPLISLRAWKSLLVWSGGSLARSCRYKRVSAYRCPSLSHLPL